MTSKPARLNAVGQSHQDFVVTKSIEIPELQCWLRELTHIPSGAQVIHIANDDSENLFCLSFQTLPKSSDGVAHILEHTVLCGSKKYPVKDPFFAMSRRSLNTFMNALTGSDFTCYPAASQVTKDFYNLLEVYLDAVFHPNLNELSFLQEGHRLEFANPKDSNSPLEYKGVVYNEMKGSLASPTARLAEEMNKALFPDITYGYNSGGDPKDIPKLTYEGLWEFYRSYYHPSRCLFFFYGNMPLEGHLDFISKNALEGVEKLDPIDQIPLQPRFHRPKHLEFEYPLPPDEDTKEKTMISFGWLTCQILEQRDLLALSILEIILMDTDASPLKQALLKSGLCKQATVYMDGEITEVPVVITLKGCNPEAADPLEDLIRSTLLEIVHTGIPIEQIETAMHQLEFFRSEIGGNHTPFGLSLFMRSALLKQHAGNPEDGLVIHSLFDQIRRQNLENPKYFPDLLKKHFLDNTHFVRIVMKPSPDLGAKELKEEKEALAAIHDALTPARAHEIIKQTLDLKDFQKQQEDEDIDVLPKIALSDVPKSSRQFLLQEEKVGNVKVFHHACFTNKIVYVDLVFDLPDFSEKELPLLRLLTVILPQMGSGGRSYSETLEYMQAHTGGVIAFLTLSHNADNHLVYTPSLNLRGKALHRQAHKLLPIMYDMATSVDLTYKERVKEVILKHYTSMYSAMNHNALRYAINLSASAIDSASKITNEWYGLDYFNAIRNIVEDLDNQLDSLLDILKAIQHRALSGTFPDMVITCEKAMYEELKSHQFFGLDKIPISLEKPWQDTVLPVKMQSQGRLISSPVAFTGHVFKTISYTHPDAAALSIAAALFDNITLHSRVREQGGAYGSGAVNNSLTGNFYFYAYRDPNISTTLNAFSEAIHTIVSGNFSESEIEEAKLEVIQSLDSPVAPGNRGDVAYSWLREARTVEVRQQFRNRLLSATHNEIKAAVKKHILPHFMDGVTVVFAGKELLERENALLEAQGKPTFVIEPI